MAANETPAPAKKEGVFRRLYTGTGAFDVVGKRKRWYIFFAALILVCLASMVFRGFNLGIDFTGGTRVSLPAQGANGDISVTQVEDAFSEILGKEPAAVQTVGTGDASTIQIRSEALNNDEVDQLKAGLFERFQPENAQGEPSQRSISDSAVSASWGGEISQQALIALGVFLVLVTIFLAMYFEKWMAVAALAALVHDIVVTAGVYSIIGFEVTPATVIGLLTILGFSLYDTVVVFDKIKENTRGLLGLTRRTYAEAANLALNQTLMRSINTSLIAVLPVIGLLVVGVGLLGVGTLQDLALVQLTGIIAGALSSICLATPILVDLKMREPKFQQQAARVKARRDNLARKAAEREESGAPDDAVEPLADDAPATDDESLDAELRQERAMAAASSVPARNQKPGDRHQRSGKPAGKQSGRPSGKRRR
ncbi:protein translocase subunit SecF [Actinophytocola algeriensis]|uniref:Protein-export membrane protein SecF n=1 Tax=Actinophytocola algeriensis TaxID=1768010 RepID=A0A7W7Q8Q4_9PSEU|nr:protein translocase subunit SecF [Actinophytocola algeriensis]MBB4908943.1 preprotein translocase subunit SecF [Actinophytocola algeriensis]MBE1474669.1 preprotein translocase subunit SecF [Actinophytocola algeriensis]